MGFVNDSVCIGIESKWGRILWWKRIRYGLPFFVSNLYDGPADLFTWGGLWVERYLQNVDTFIMER